MILGLGGDFGAGPEFATPATPSVSPIATLEPALEAGVVEERFNMGGVATVPSRVARAAAWTEAAMERAGATSRGVGRGATPPGGGNGFGCLVVWPRLRWAWVGTAGGVRLATCMAIFG